MKIARSLAVAVFAASALSTSLFAQAPEGGGNRQGRGNFDPAEMRQRMAERLKTSLKTTDEEWTVLQPLIENVTTKQRAASGGGWGGRGGRGGRGGGDNNASASETPRPGQAETQALRTTLENESAAPDDIKAKLTAVREQRKKASAELAQAREELRKVLTVRQEAVLVSFGILE